MPDDLLLKLTEAPWYHGQIACVEEIPPSEAALAEVALHPALQTYLDQKRITLYRHQCEVIEAVRAGNDVVITTPTASGKTLSFNLPIFEGLITDPRSNALYLYPLKALANDQLQKLLELERSTGIHLAPSTYDGDTPASRRGRIKQTARIILTNPHALHYYLPWHYQWERFFTNLRYIVIDEAHRYRGVFGTNVALLLWRLSRILSHYEAAPQVILSSASIANPALFARDLTGREVTSVSEDSSAHGTRQVLFWDALTDPHCSLSTQAAQLVAFLTASGIQTLCFTGSRAMAEVVARATRELGAKKVLSYRAGYLPQERRRIEAGLRNGQIDGVVSTNALEVGIDIGGLDAVILVGFPGSLLAAWQQAGRAGRGSAPSLVFFMPYEDPLDQYLLRHPDHFLGKERERIVLRTENPRLKVGHLACAAAELPLKTWEVSEEDEKLLDELVENRLLAKTSRGYIYRGAKRAHATVSLDDIAGQVIKLMCEGHLLETMDRLRACRDAYPGAILLHRGESYVVERLDLEEGIAQARQEDVDYYTKSLRTSSVEILTTGEAFEGSSVTGGRGRVRVTESFIGYKTIHFDRTISVEPLALPPHTYESDALWLSFPKGVPNLSHAELLGGLHGAEHALIAIAPLLVLCDREDIAGVSSPLHEQTNLPTIILFDGIQGGAGLAEVLYTSFGRLAEAALRLVSDCPCTDGCPSCIYSPRCGSHNQPLSKDGTIKVLRLLSKVTNTGLKVK
jgi:DEAD/DEAH box helicase domain-containing protein